MSDLGYDVSYMLEELEEKMIKEELEKEALEKYKTGSYSQIHPDHYAFIHGYVACAEPREKRIAELEQKLEQTEKDLADYQFNYPKIKELEKEIKMLRKVAEDWKESCHKAWKENEELKAEIENDRDLPTIAYMQGAEKQKKKDEEQFTEAKDIIEDLLYYLGSCTCDRSNYAELDNDIKRAKEFIKE